MPAIGAGRVQVIPADNGVAAEQVYFERDFLVRWGAGPCRRLPLGMNPESDEAAVELETEQDSLEDPRYRTWRSLLR